MVKSLYGRREKHWSLSYFFEKRNGVCNENMKIQTSNDVEIGKIRYFTELMGDAPISVYVIAGEKGDMLIDTGFSTTSKSLQKWISKNGFHITDIFLTHAHPDHDWNAAKFKRMFNARIWLGKEDVSLIRNFSDQPQHPTHKRFGFRVKWISFWTKTPFFKSKKYTPDVIVDESANDLARKYGYDIEIIPLPGHTKGSYGILKDGVLYAGDAYAVINGIPIKPPHAYSIDDLEESIKKISKIAPKYLACGHGVPLLFDKHILSF